MKKISIITPCYNEEKNLLNCIEEIKKLFNKTLSKYDYEHIISDNNSNDQTPTILKKVAMGRIGKPEDIASTIFFLTESKYTTGQIINVDGGRFSF